VAPPRPASSDKPGKSAEAKPPRREKAPKPPGKRRRLVSLRGVIATVVIALVAAIIAAAAGLIYYDGKLTRVNALSFSGRIAPTPGTNWLIVGTDSREGLTAAERKKLSTGPDEGGARTDTIMLISKPKKGKTAIISIPRDLYVEVPGYGSHKINAAFNLGGPQLLVQTVESVSGVHIDHYAEIGFGGFAKVVDSIGGIRICLKTALRDPKAGLRLRAGCQKINGRQALGLVRSRDYPNADLQRVINQRKVFAALMAKATSPGVMLNPFRLLPFVNGVVDSMTVDQNDHSWNLLLLALSLRGSPTMATVPTGAEVWGADGDALSMDSSTEEFFSRLAHGKAVEPTADGNDSAVG
jgi:LCP family protein required for cell wall assembly